LGSKIETLSKESFDLPFKINVDGKGLTISNIQVISCEDKLK
jgi:hypothetical protein